MQFLPSVRSKTKLILILLLAQFSLFAQPPGIISGRIFTDYNLDGIDNDNGPGIAGIVIHAFDETGLVGTLNSGVGGIFSISGLTDGKRYRFEFTVPASLTTVGSSFFGADAPSTIQFITCPADDVSQGFSAPEDYCQPNPFALVPCYVSGDPLGGGTANDDALVAVPYTASGQGQTSNTYIATSAKIGTTWGVAFQRETKTAFMASVLKRHAGFGPGGTGAIYVQGVNAIGSPVDLGWFSLDSLGVNTGTDPRIGEPLPINKEDASFDSLAYPLVGKMSFGDLEISPDGKYLYVVNLFDKTLLKIFINNPYVKPSASDVTVIPFTNPGCSTTNDWAPWGLKVYRGEVYAGLVCTAESTQDTTQLRAHVMKLSPANTWSPVFDFGLSFERGIIIDNTPSINNWYAWTNDPTKIFNNFKFILPQPILSDIEFDTDGSMILGFADRLGLQGGFLNYGPTASQGFAITTFAGGDIIRVCNVAGSFVLEGAAGSCQNTTGATQVEGPNGKEFYWSDAFADPSTNLAAFRTHNEVALGALCLLPGSGEVLSSIYDPFAFNTNGLTYFDNSTGARTRNYEIFPDAPGFFGKATGLGDAELLCNAAPLEKGNYVWKDLDGDGIQDANEPPIAGVNVSMVDGNCQILATATTDVNGEYYFNETLFPALSLDQNTSYFIVVGTLGQFSTTNQLLFDSLEVTLANTGEAPNNDLNDSDGEIAGSTCFIGLPYTEVTTGGAGSVNHACDFGFKAKACDIAWQLANKTDEVCAGDQNGTISLTAITSDPAGVEYAIGTNAFGSSSVFTQLAPATYTLLAQVVGNSACAIDTMLTILPGITVTAPTAVSNDSICQYLTPVTGSGLRATASPCPAGYGAAEIRWYASATSTVALATGPVFNPVTAGLVNTNMPGAYTYYAESNCAPCASARVPATYTVNPAPIPVITGDTLPCPGETVVFTTPMNTGSSYAWQLLGQGTIVGLAQNQLTVMVPDSSDVPPIKIVVTETNRFGCVATDTLEIKIRIVTLVCQNEVQISLDQNCCSKIFPDQVLSGTYPSYDFTVTIRTASGIPVQGDSICGVGNYVVTVQEMCSNNTCWANVVAEDKLPPVINCQPLSFPCSYTDTHVVLPDLSSNPVFAQPFGAIGGVVVNDNCGLASLSYADDYFKYNCDTLFGVVSGVLVRTWFASDVSGNTSSCTQNITYIRQPVTNIVWPSDIELNCTATDLTPATTGYPTIAGIPVDFDAHGFCDLDFTYTDQVQPVCSGSKKIIRTWLVYNWCQPLNANNPNIPLNPLTHIQLIKVLDTTPPVVNCPSDMIVSTEPTSCTAVLELPDVIAADGCSYISSAVAVTPVGNVNGVLSNFPGNNLWSPDTLVAFSSVQGLGIGAHDITYNIFDDCGNKATCAFKVIVRDQVKPTAVCKTVTKVALSNDGTALVNAISLDNGSYDNCSQVHYKARRMLASDCVPTNFDLFNDKVKFCCSDIGDTVIVVFRAYDQQPLPGAVSGSYLEDRSNDCMVRVIVEDKLRPSIQCPANVSVNCNAFDPTFWSYGSPNVVDNCGIDTVTTSISYAQFDTLCKQGLARRTFVARDLYGNTNSCVQTINVSRVVSFKVQWPDDVVVTQCNMLGNTGAPKITDVLCGITGMSYTDEKITVVPDACYKIVRKWRVQDLCEDITNALPLLILNPTNSNAGPVTIANNSNRGYLEYNQIIKVVDNEGPVVLNCPTAPVIFNDLTTNDPTLYNDPLYWDPAHQSHDLCEGLAPLSIRVSDACSGADLNVQFTLFLDTDNNGVMETGIYSGTVGAPVLVIQKDSTVMTASFHSNFQLPYGTHKIKWTISDGCGNISSCEYTFTIRDGKAPTLTCLNGLAVNIMPNGMITMWASDFLQYGQDNCTPSSMLEYGIRKAGTGTGWPSTTNVTFDCTQVGTQIVQLYARDKAGNMDFCETYLLVQDNSGNCSTNKADVAGSLKTEATKAVDNAMVTLTGSNNALPNPVIFTNSTGTYNFNAIPIGDNYVVSANRGGDWMNGVNSLDILRIQRHILGLDPLATPYKQIAADVNKTGSVTGADIVQLRKLILGAIDSIPGNTSWRFVDKKHVFTNPINPFTSPIPEVISIQNLQNQISDGDFVAVKVGDPSGDAVPNAQAVADDRREPETVIFDVKDVTFAEGEKVKVQVSTSDLARILAYQFTLRFDPAVLAFDDLTSAELSDMSLENYSLANIEKGLITTSFNTSSYMTGSQAICTLTFTARKAGNLRAALHLSHAVTPAVAFDQDGLAYDVALRFDSDDTVMAPQFEVFQNSPNPFNEKTNIGISLPGDSNVRLTIFDTAGQPVYRTEKDLTKGLHNFEILSGSVRVKGLLYYRVESAFGTIERKMIHMNR